MEQKKKQTIKKTSKNKRLLISFVEFCNKHPEQRFWQALCNWAGASSILFNREMWSEDTFHWCNKDEFDKSIDNN